MVHADVIGKLDQSLGAHYALDDCTRYSEVVCLSSKDTVAQAIISMLRQWEPQAGWKTQVIRTDGRTEFMGELDEFCVAKWIVHQRSLPYTHGITAGLSI